MTTTTVGQTTRDLEGKPTSVIVQPFADRVLILVTQLGKVGNLVQASLPHSAPLMADLSPEGLPTPPAAIQLSTLLGSAPNDRIRILHSLYASQIATIVWVQESTGAIEASRRSVVVGLALQPVKGDEDDEITERERRTFHGVMDMVKQLCRQA